MEVDTKENSDLERKKEKDNSHGKMEQYILVNLKMGSCKVKVSINFLMERFMKDSSERTKDMEEEDMYHL
jgi:hypothetical protein